ncbi:class I SAM-dependent methyltransferase [Actomonas aquatica]|uniref:SAM-dependent methyltransferase n=1 Tax=Actomonas aquatica TaxID=2866162 RepID=A0ABZ1CF39_9BACT|nr:SAM-dependent methyltransferase [Opitutus sp. WL0086]WRQ88905.1 SAM-dependent methyltransferase [Opitutus sp. WL0086]
MSQLPPRERFLTALRQAVADDALVKLTLGHPSPDADPTLRNLFVRPVALKAGPHLSFVTRHETRDLTKNHPPEAALAEIEHLLGFTFLDAHLFTPAQTVQFTTAPNGRCRVKFQLADSAPPAPSARHDKQKSRLVDTHAGWLQDLGVTSPEGQPRPGMAAKYRQIQKFAETLSHLLTTAGLIDGSALRVADMGAGKGYLTFATAALLGPTARVTGIERRNDLVDTCNRVARAHELTGLSFTAGDINSAAADLTELDVLIALHACDTATDDALAAGIRAGAALLVVSPCCQKELRPQLTAPPVLAPALRHGIFQERHTEFVTDAMRALLLEAVGFETKVFEFVSTEHTARNVMLAAWRSPEASRVPRPAAVQRVREFAAFYGISDHALARHLDIPLG